MAEAGEEGAEPAPSGGLLAPAATAEKGLMKAVAAEKAFLPRMINFVPASASSSGLQSAPVDPERDGPVPAYYLFPRDRLRELLELNEPRHVGRGLNNAGNTCFFNSVLQTLTYTRPLQNYLLSGEHQRVCPNASERIFCAFCQFERHAKEALSNNKSPVFPKAMLKHLKQLGGKSIQLGRQEDAHEFLLHFLDSCHKAVLQPFTLQGTVPPVVQRTTLIHQLFGGYLRSRVVCQECKHETNTFDPFLDLSLEVRNVSTLDKALEGFTKSELLAGPNRYRCKKCERPVDVTKRFFLHRLPPLLMFQLKRFEFSQGIRGKIVKNVSFGTSLDLARFTSQPDKEAKYRLYGVIVHQGHSAKSGHYYAYVRHCSGTWYHFDDAHVRPVSEQQVLRVQAYLLFYEAQQLPPDLCGPVANGRPDAAGDAAGKSAALNGNAACAAAAAAESLGAAALNGHAGGTNGSVGRQAPAEGPRSTERQPPTQSPLNGAAAPQKRRPEKDARSKAERAKAAKIEDARADASAEESSSSDSDLTVRRRLHLGRSSRRLRLLRRRCKRRRTRPSRPSAASPGEAAVAEEEAKVPVLPAPAPRLRRPVVRMADLAAASKKVDHRSQYGRAEVSRWEDDAPEEPSQAFLDAQRELQPEPERRDELDRVYDVGKLKHKVRKAKPVFSGKSAFDKEQTRREKVSSAWSRGRGRFGGDEEEQFSATGDRRKL